MLERDVSRAIKDYLEIGMVQEKWWFDRLNVGVSLASYGGKTRAFRSCRNGTADFIVIRRNLADRLSSKVVFIEAKGSAGKQRIEQADFQKAVEKQGCFYILCRDVSELEKVLPINEARDY